eukprot:TRINITY_DN16081_c0_g1_i2.p1 TRINITY_DN16081_c0_g1~~TRINITY_DN16081_c0_g1_i2.p1  ORF type:complete len:229 (+),score=93.57 TRINITY_DN16081_c0_g1_i2:578-1264(+)
MSEESKIRYGVVANWGGPMGKPQLLAEVSSCTVMNVPHITKIILEKIRCEDHKMTYTYDKFLFHYIVSDRICYLCMADESFDRRVPFEFLEAVKAKFKQVYADRWSTVHQVKELKDFTAELNRQMVVANSGENDIIRKVKKDIDETKDIMNKNIDTLLTRGEKIDILSTRADELNTGATKFKAQSKDLHWAMWKRKVMMTAIVVFVILLIIFIIVLIVCGGFKFEKCK